MGNLEYKISDMLPILAHKSVRILKPEIVLKTIQQIAADGFEKLMFIVDFDQTLSRSTLDENGENGFIKKAKNSLDIIYDFAQSSDESVRNKFESIAIRYENFMCNEKDDIKREKFETDISVEFYDAIVDSRLSYEKLNESVRNTGIRLRANVHEFFAKLGRCELPCVIFSAGVGNAIEMIIEEQLKGWPMNAHLISNMLKFDEKGVVAGYSEPLIHLYNKQLDVSKRGQYFLQAHADRANVILIGDSLGDVNMDAIVPHRENVLKIGFLNLDIEKNLATYMEQFDVIVLEDQSFDVPLGVLDFVCRK